MPWRPSCGRRWTTSAGGPLARPRWRPSGWAPGHGAAGQIRRRRAALAYGVSVERFRKHHERIVLEQVGEEILKLSEPPAAARPTTPRHAELDRQIGLTGTIAGLDITIAVHIEPVELLRDVDVLVVPENV